MPSDQNLDKLFSKLISNLDFDPAKYFVHNELTGSQEKIFEKAKEIIEENIDGEIRKFGSKFNEEEFKKLEDEFEKRLENSIFKDSEKDLRKLMKKYLDLKKEEVENYVFAIFPVKDMPFPSVSFMNFPKIVWKKGKIDKMSLNTEIIGYGGEIRALVTRTTLYGRTKKTDPLFAPHIGPLDLAGYKPDPENKQPLSENPRFLYEIQKSLERKTTRNQINRYDDQYERHGEPICDFLMKDEKLLESLANLTSAIDSKRMSSSAAIPAIVLTLRRTSLILSLDESGRSKKYEKCFEALINLAAASYETPNVKKGGTVMDEAEQMTQAAESNTPSGAGIGSLAGSGPSSPPGQPNIPVWTAEELAEEAKKRGVPAQNMPVWTEDELAEEVKKRGPASNLPVWTEEDLEKEKARRHGAFNIPEWEEDDSLKPCPKCEYSCRPSWGECPVCGASLNDLGAVPKPDPSSQKPGPQQPQPSQPSQDSSEAKEETKPESPGSDEPQTQ